MFNDLETTAMFNGSLIAAEIPSGVLREYDTDPYLDPSIRGAVRNKRYLCKTAEVPTGKTLTLGIQRFAIVSTLDLDNGLTELTVEEA